jgi:hypothetical protein
VEKIASAAKRKREWRTMSLEVKFAATILAELRRWSMSDRATRPLPPVFSQVFILKGLKVLYFDTDLQVFILKVVSMVQRRRERNRVRAPARQEKDGKAQN